MGWFRRLVLGKRRLEADAASEAAFRRAIACVRPADFDDLRADIRAAADGVVAAADALKIAIPSDPPAEPPDDPNEHEDDP